MVEALDWRMVPGASAYVVSEQGDIRRRQKALTRPLGYSLKGRLSRSGYRVYALRFDDGVDRDVFGHRAVASAFLPAAPSSNHQIAHCDGDRLNNNYRNLRWVLAQANADDRQLHGTQPYGADVSQAKLTWDQVEALRAEYTGARGQQAQLAAKYRVSAVAVSRIIRGLRYSHQFADAKRRNALLRSDNPLVFGPTRDALREQMGRVR